MIFLGRIWIFFALITVSEGKTHPSNVGTFNKANPPVEAQATPNPDPFLGFKPDPDPTKREEQYGKHFYQRNMPVHPYRPIRLPTQSEPNPPAAVNVTYPSASVIRPF
jgi:hypothetical protein